MSSHSTRRPRSIEVEGVNHGQAPIPMGARVGNMLFSSGIHGADPATGKVPEGDVQSQARFAFANMRSLLTNGGATLEDVVRMTVHVKDNSARPHVNEHWLACFPDPHDRPARHIVVTDLPGALLVQLEIVAVIQEAP